MAGNETDGTAPLQSADHAAPRWRGVAAWAGGWGAVLALALWMRHPLWTWLGVAAVAALLWTVLGVRDERRWRAGAAAALGVALLVGAGVQLQLREVALRWDEVRESAEDRAGEALSRDLEELVDRGEAAVDSAIAAARERGSLFAALREIRAETGVSALAVYGPDGRPLAWTGEHRGTIPDSVREGVRPYFFSASPLFGYLYFTRNFGEGRTAVAAVLLEASVAVDEEVEPFAEQFAERHGVTPRFTIPARAQGGSVWDWATDVPILSVSFARLTQERWRERIVGRGRWAAGAVAGIAFALLSAAWYRRRRGPPGAPVAVATLGLFLVPLGEMTGAEELFSPLYFVLPLPVDVTLGDLMVLLAGGGVWLLTRGRPRVAPRPWQLVLRTALAGLVLPLAFGLVRSSASGTMLAAHSAGGVALILAGTLAIALPLHALFPRPQGDAGRAGAGWWVPAVLLPVALGVGAALWWTPERELPFWLPALWAIPFGLFASGFARSRAGRGALLPWLAAGWIGGTVSASHLWAAHLDARVAQVEDDLARLGTVPDPYLDFLLRQFAERALFHAAEGREGASLLYQSWVSGGLARSGHEARVTLWEGPSPAAELHLSDIPRPDSLIVPMLPRARAAEEPIVERFTRQEWVHYLLLVPVPGGRVISVAVPPRRHIGRSAAPARLLDLGRGPDTDEGPIALSLVPVRDTARTQAPPPGEMRWLRTPGGWRREARVDYPSGPAHAHLLVRVPSPVIVAVRAVLVLALGLGSLAALWVVGRTLCGEPFGLARREWLWSRTFRGRLTLALFVFFLLPMAVFATAAYQALAREVARTAAALANRALEQAAAEAEGQPLSALGEHVGADLLRYENGVLVDASSPEVLDLGVYNTWLPPEIYRTFAADEDVEYREAGRLGGREYLVAYRTVAPGEVLAAPTPLASGEIARRQRELATVVILAVLLGAGLSVVLSLLVGRALSRPIEDLSRAASAVGAGNLRVRLPEDREDEFGGLYRSFNRMVRRIRRGRAAVERETRRTEAIVAEAGTGVLALDPAGRVALINARAEEILGTEVAPGRPFPEDTPIAAALARVVHHFRRSGEAEHGEEMEVGGRVVRLRFRRLRGEEGTGGAVVALEDITSEIRSARVLAWGEMARQVAHEIKNPLTPIKLSVQHLRRAYADGRTDFEQILERNVGAILAEIDRLGEIARAFARFGTPEQAAGDLEPVELRRVVEETLALYRGGGDGIGYRVEIDPATPPVYARVGELKEVLVNLLENARAALPEGGEIRFATAPAGGGEWVMLDVADTGEGIPPDLLPRVFEPQFSTRTSGTGLGLAIVRRLVESWGGEVTVDSEPGVGTTVHLRFRAVG